MKVKLKTAMASERWWAKSGQIIECSEKAGKRLVEKGRAIEADPEAEAEKTLPEGPPPKPKPWARRPPPEKAVTPTAETPEDPGDTCAGTTNAGNPCKRAPQEGSEFCAGHQEGEGEAAE
ncbi:hypothetical protein LCGC14_2775060 [marine sediment metagenome]|uniref:Uncharacterized protein n=1 Tax=marine sediment metagenome TaxID=412755 RepID=A0A0F8YUX9_9ZZZZ